MSRDHGLDRLLDRAVAPGYTNVGHALRRLTWSADDPRPDALAGRRALVTGAGRGLGEAAALGLARLGARVHLLVRSADRAADATERIAAKLAKEGRTADLAVEECDISDLAAVRNFADAFVRRNPSAALDVLVHNAGLMPPERTESSDGHELTVATHVLGPVLLTDRLLPLLTRSHPGARTVWVSSGGMYTQALPVDDPDFTVGRYSGAIAYARSKRMQVELLPRLAERWAPDRVSVLGMHPGWADTPGVADSLPLFRLATRPFLRTAASGADTVVWLAATEPPPASGTFWHDRAERPTSYRRRTRPSDADVDRLWAWVQEVAGVS